MKKRAILICFLAFAFLFVGGCSVLTGIGEKLGIIKPAAEEVAQISSQPFLDEQITEQLESDLDNDGNPEVVYIVGIPDNTVKNEIYIYGEGKGYFRPEIVNDQKYDLDFVLYHDLWAQGIPEYQDDTPTDDTDTDVVAEIDYSGTEPKGEPGVPGGIVSFRDGAFWLFISPEAPAPSTSPSASASQ